MGTSKGAMSRHGSNMALPLQAAKVHSPVAASRQAKLWGSVHPARRTPTFCLTSSPSVDRSLSPLNMGQ